MGDEKSILDRVFDLATLGGLAYLDGVLDNRSQERAEKAAQAEAAQKAAQLQDYGINGPNFSGSITTVAQWAVPAAVLLIAGTFAMKALK